MSKIIIHKDLIVQHYNAKDKEDILLILGERMKNGNYVSDEFAEKVIEREEKYPTGLKIGKYNIAIPHTEPKYVSDSCVGVAILDTPVDFQQMDDSDNKIKVHIILLLALNKAHSHVKVLSNIIQMFQNEKIVTQLLNAEHEEEVIGVLENNLLGGAKNE